mmetsp:Transcript_13292/g.37414  ORF Transcript_13292/g.37414 Transcript_13292/m.37414 type:complete len:321 (-) Transcript_13292:1813-2775(-)
MNASAFLLSSVCWLVDMAVAAAVRFFSNRVFSLVRSLILWASSFFAVVNSDLHDSNSLKQESYLDCSSFCVCSCFSSLAFVCSFSASAASRSPPVLFTATFIDTSCLKQKSYCDFSSSCVCSCFSSLAFVCLFSVRAEFRSSLVLSTSSLIDSRSPSSSVTFSLMLSRALSLFVTSACNSLRHVVSSFSQVLSLFFVSSSSAFASSRSCFVESKVTCSSCNSWSSSLTLLLKMERSVGQGWSVLRDILESFLPIVIASSDSIAFFVASISSHSDIKALMRSWRESFSALHFASSSSNSFNCCSFSSCPFSTCSANDSKRP